MEELPDDYICLGPKNSGLAWFLTEDKHMELRPAPGTKDTEQKRVRAKQMTTYILAVQRLATEIGTVPTPTKHALYSMGNTGPLALHLDTLPEWFEREMAECGVMIAARKDWQTRDVYMVPLELPAKDFRGNPLLRLERRV